jgi:Tat protein translocase TatB subunit
MNLGPAEILVIAVVALLVFGPKRLPDVARQVGGAMRELRKMQDHVKSELDTVIHPDVTPPPSAAVGSTTTSGAIEETDHTSFPSPTIEPEPDPEPTNQSDGFANPGSFS